MVICMFCRSTRDTLEEGCPRCRPEDWEGLTAYTRLIEESIKLAEAVDLILETRDEEWLETSLPITPRG